MAPGRKIILSLVQTEFYFGIELFDGKILSYSLPPKPPSGAFAIRFSGDTRICFEDECIIEVMNDGQPLVIDFEFNDGGLTKTIPPERGPDPQGLPSALYNGIMRPRSY